MFMFLVRLWGGLAAWRFFKDQSAERCRSSNREDMMHSQGTSCTDSQSFGSSRPPSPPPPLFNSYARFSVGVPPLQLPHKTHGVVSRCILYILVNTWDATVTSHHNRSTPSYHPTTLPLPLSSHPNPFLSCFDIRCWQNSLTPPPKKKPSLILNIDKYSNRLSRIGRPVQLQERHVKRLSDEGGGRQGS